MQLSQIPNIKHTEANNFFLLAGPCAIEGEDMALRIAEKVLEITNKLEIPYIFKGSFKKANRSRIDSFTGIGDEKALKILRKVSETFKIPTVTDIHGVSDAEMAAAYVDVLQIPAFLVRQTDLVVAAAKTGKVVNLKKGQFMSPEAMGHAVQKVKDAVDDARSKSGFPDIPAEPTISEILLTEVSLQKFSNPLMISIPALGFIKFILSSVLLEIILSQLKSKTKCLILNFLRVSIKLRSNNGEFFQ